MMPAIHERTDAWRAQQVEQGTRCRNLFAAVVLNELNIAATEIRKMRADKYPAEKIEHRIRRFMIWANSRDGREVMELAGINHDAFVLSAMEKLVRSGHFSAYALRSGRQNVAA